MAGTLDADRWDELGSLIVQVLELPTDQRSDFLDVTCGVDTPKRREVDALLAAYEEAPDYFDSLSDSLFGKLPPPAAGLPPQPDPHQLVGQTVGPYRVDELLGGGGMGVVYKAEDTRLRRTVALKFLPPLWSRDERARRRFLREAQAASALDHPAICTVYEINDTADGQVFIAMAYYAGETLHATLRRGALPLASVLDWTLQMADGLAQAHTRGIVHRDVKPANVIITDGRVKLLDFGLAKLTDTVQITRSGTLMGTAAYMAPEQARGEALDHRADVWALGAVLYEMVSGQRAFPGDNPQAVIYGLLNHDPPPVTGLRSGVPMQLAHVINKALSRDLGRRYASMHDLMADLKAVQARLDARTSVVEAVLPSAPAAPAPTALTTIDEPEDERVHLLVVDDEPELELLMRQKFRRKIRAGDWVFTFAVDGHDALHQLDLHSEIDVVLTDLNMPKMDGLTLLSKLHDLNRPIKTVVVSAYGDLSNIRTAMNRGAFDFVTKPIDFVDLETTIEKTHTELRAYRQATEAQRQVAAMQQELEVARRIQEAILPVAFPQRADVDLYAFTTTASNVSGTFYDFFEMGDHRVGFLIGDVAGKGVSAALFMAMSQTFLKGVARQDEVPGACLTEMNRVLYPQGFPDLAVTVCYGVLDTSTGTVLYANAGHPAPYLVGPNRVEPLPGTAPPVWKDRDTVYATHQVTLTPGEGLFLFTDGVPRAIDEAGQPFTTERLAATLRSLPPETSAARRIRDIVREVMNHIDDAPLIDDLTVLALRFLGVYSGA